LVQSPIPNDTIDTLVLLNVLEHIKDDTTALKKAFNMLKPGGSIILEVPAGPRLYDNYDKALNHFRRYTAKELKDKCNKAGFTVKRLSHLGFFIFPLFA
jgi:predicted SAM-dependent methyltransferase